MKTCFVVCPIGLDGSETRKRSDELLRYIIEPVCKKCGFTATRVDNINASDSINQTILDNLKNSDLVIADLTEHNPNAFYELGYRFALGKPLIQLKHKDDSIPFDVSTIRTFDYDLNSVSSTEELKERLEQTINSFSYATEEKNELILEKTPENFNSQILQELFSIQDSIKELDKKVSTSSTDSATISLLVDKLNEKNSKPSTEDIMIQTLLQTALNDPSKLQQLLELSKKFPTAK
ncbi:nucleoside 2-deoxyribosyltransferase [Clostridium perfringens]|uniref:nucleoside 2-deoxyribosyltransferase n=1 Tax=Clostridium perfringens TaxID=1502 RepID=UPI000D8C0B2F|nr:nucleoside 2-deoxyribosyltransferase [Clostridium perfringens]